MDAVVVSTTTLNKILDTGFNWTLQTNLEKEERCWPEVFAIAENERAHFASDLRRRPEQMLSEDRFRSIKTVVFNPLPEVFRIYTRQ